MWHNYSPANRPDTIFNFMEGSLSILVQKQNTKFYVSCNMFDIVSKVIPTAKDAKEAKKKALETVMEAAANLCNICNEAITKI